jgi:hypothetical protein
MTSPSPVKASDALEELVNQFSDPLSFFRELIQNAIDAGSSEVEVWIDYEAGKGEDGAIVIRVDDWGDGMDRHIIETRLTRLFSSAKDGDMTKIGKFGIGFVSVFAINPDAVVVDTSRGGEHWRVIFDAQRKFTQLKRDEPVEGTKIRIFKSGTKAEYEDFVKRAERTVRYWCKHLRGEVRFQGKLVNEAFDLEFPCRLVHDDGFSKIVVAHPRQRESFFGFYNQGLTLIEGGSTHFEGIAFKISSPHLEHTLTRDNVIEDDAFRKVMGDVARLARTDLCVRAFEALAANVAGNGSVEEREYLFGAVLWHLQDGHPLPEGVEELPVLPVCGDGAAASIARVRKQLNPGWGKRGRVLWSNASTPLTTAMAARGDMVIELAEDSAGVAVIRLLSVEGGDPDDPTRFDRLRRAHALYCRPLPLEEGTGSPFTRLSEVALSILSAFGAKVSGVHFGRFKYQGSWIAKRVVISQEEFGQISELDDLDDLGTSFFSDRRALVVNADHPTVEVLVRLSETEPELAAYQLIKLFFLNSKLDTDRDQELVMAAWEQRWQRSSNS